MAHFVGAISNEKGWSVEFQSPDGVGLMAVEYCPWCGKLIKEGAQVPDIIESDYSI